MGRTYVSSASACFVFVLTWNALFVVLQHRFFLVSSASSPETNLRAKLVEDQQHAANPRPLPRCTPSQRAVIRQQLPPDLCLKFAERPWKMGGLCSFSFATRCPSPLWLTQVYAERAASSEPFVAMYVGCNKGMDAIDTLRMGSRNSTFDKSSWRQAILGDQERFKKQGSCRQEHSSQFDLASISHSSPDALAVLHCIEPLPANSKRLREAARSLQIDLSFRVHPMALSNIDGFAYFPSDAALGAERKGIDTCTSRRRRQSCEKVPVYTLDTFASQNINTRKISFLSIDAEGYDPFVLLGGDRTIPTVEYFEFEYNWKGAWQNVSLQFMIERLHRQGFYCYWAGSHGNLWRITDCWLRYYHTKVWSNIACVNMDSKHLLDSMEEYFRITLDKGSLISYRRPETAKTDGTVSNHTGVTLGEN